MFKYSFEQAHDFMDVCEQAADSIAQSCEICGQSVSSMIENGFSGEAATGSELSFLKWYASATQSTVSFSLLKSALKRINTDAQTLKRSAEAIPASIGAASDVRLAWTTSEVAAEGSAVNLSGEVQSIVDIEISAMENTLVEMSDRLSGIPHGTEALSAIEALKTNLVEQKSKLDGLKSATTTFVDGVSSFEEQGALTLAGLGLAVSESTTGADLAEYVSGENSTILSGLELPIASGIFDVASVQSFKNAGLKGASIYNRVYGYTVLEDGAIKFKGIGNHGRVGDVGSFASGVKYANFAKGLGWAGSALSVGSAWWSGYTEDPYASDIRKKANADVEATIEIAGVGVSAGSGVAAGGAVGALVGSTIPVLGTAVGCAVGMFVAWGYSIFNEEVLHAEREDGSSFADDWKYQLEEDIKRRSEYGDGNLYPGLTN